IDLARERRHHLLERREDRDTFTFEPAADRALFLSVDHGCPHQLQPAKEHLLHRHQEMPPPVSGYTHQRGANHWMDTRMGVPASSVEKRRGNFAIRIFSTSAPCRAASDTALHENPARKSMTIPKG